jgi:hypothetical protein
MIWIRLWWLLRASVIIHQSLKWLTTQTRTCLSARKLRLRRWNLCSTLLILLPYTSRIRLATVITEVLLLLRVKQVLLWSKVSTIDWHPLTVLSYLEEMDTHNIINRDQVKKLISSIWLWITKTWLTVKALVLAESLRYRFPKMLQLWNNFCSSKLKPLRSKRADQCHPSWNPLADIHQPNNSYIPYILYIYIS